MKSRQRKPRPGKYSVGNMIFRPQQLSLEQRGLLMYFDSFSDNWVFHVASVLADTGLKRGKYFKLRKALVEFGCLRTEKVYALNPETGRHEVDAFRAFTDMSFLSVQNRNLQNPSKCRISTSSKTTLLRRPIDKGRPDFDVIDDGDVGF